jgi:hypothetical protein
MRSVVCAFFALICAVALGRAQAQTTMLNFACEGKMTGTLISEEKPESLHNVGLVVNLADKTVSFGGFVAPFSSCESSISLITNMPHGLAQ